MLPLFIPRLDLNYCSASFPPSPFIPLTNQFSLSVALVHLAPHKPWARPLSWITFFIILVLITNSTPTSWETGPPEHGVGCHALVAGWSSGKVCVRARVCVWFAFRLARGLAFGLVSVALGFGGTWFGGAGV